MFVWTIGDVIGIVVACIFAIVALLFVITNWAMQTICKHDWGVTETQACNAICRKCGRNLGFIGTWREKQRLVNDRNAESTGS